MKSSSLRSMYCPHFPLSILSASLCTLCNICLSFNMHLCILFPLLLLAWLAADPIYGATTFDPQCTVPPSSVNLVSSPGVRGTLHILWSSFWVKPQGVETATEIQLHNIFTHPEIPKPLWLLARSWFKSLLRESTKAIFQWEGVVPNDLEYPDDDPIIVKCISGLASYPEL